MAGWGCIGIVAGESCVHLCVEKSVPKRVPEVLAVGGSDDFLYRRGGKTLGNVVCDAPYRNVVNTACVAHAVLGFECFDKCVADSVNLGRPFVVNYPRLKISGCIADVANRLGYL
jgi:hypothetical protein